MIRHRKFISTLLMTGLLALTPVPAAAFTISSGAFANWQAHIRAGNGFVRVGTVLSGERYFVRILHSPLAKPFDTLPLALSFARSRQNAAVLDGTTGTVVFTNIPDLYEVKLTSFSASSVSAGNGAKFSSLDAAVSAVKDTPNASIVNRLTGMIVWTNAANYWVVTPGSVGAAYQTYADAVAAASAAQNATIESVPLGAPVWQSHYEVQINGTFAKSFQTFADAKAFAVNSPQSEVIDTATGKDVWDDVPRYDVYQNGILVKQFSQEQDALTFANGLQNVTVVQISTQTTVFSNVPAYLVEVGAKIMQSFALEQPAIAYAKTLTGAVVIQISNNQIVWSPATGAYGVYRYLQLVRSFNSLAQAEAYAKTLDHVQVINTATNQVAFSNYPATVKTPYGDVFTVQSGIVVDTWGKLVVPLAPAPVFMKPGQSYVSDDYNHWYQVLATGDQYVGQWENPYQTLDIETSSTLTAQQINQFIATHAVSSSVLQGTGNYFIEAEKAYGVNAEYLVAHAIIESAWGTSYFAKNRNNLFGYRAYTSNPDAAATFRSIEYDINFQAWFVRNSYLNQTGAFFNGPNLDGMNVDYATDPYWANSIARVMSEFEIYTTTIGAQPLMPQQATRTVFPYPAGANGQALSTLAVYAVPPDTTGSAPKAIGNIAKGTTFPVLGDSPGWDEVQLAGGEQGFVDWNGVSLQNIVEVTGITAGSNLSLRSAQAVSTSNVLDQIPNGTYLVLLNAPSNGWARVENGDGKQGWVASQYIQVIH